MRCNLCPRQCGALRTETAGEGRCRMPGVPVVARAALHMWEEPPISGTNGSGTVFFSGCSLGCVFCQNHRISQEDFGRPVTVERLREICCELIGQGAHNVNLVNPTHFVPAILDALALYRPPVPIVYNTSGYERVEILRQLEGAVDIYLPDLKYLDGETAGRYSGAPDYPEAAQAAIREMVRQTGPYELGPDGLLRRGVIVRHLILPGRVNEAKAVMDWVAETFPAGTGLFSLMRQYVPQGRAAEFPEIDRKLRASEARTAAEYMENLGLEGFVQEGAAADSGYIPPFDLTGVE